MRLTVAPMAVGSVIGAVIGGLLVGVIAVSVLKVLLGTVLIASSTKDVVVELEGKQRYRSRWRLMKGIVPSKNFCGLLQVLDGLSQPSSGGPFSCV